MTIAKREITTLFGGREVRSMGLIVGDGVGRAYQDQAFRAETTGFMLAETKEDPEKGNRIKKIG
jgi:hypothetical protein